jgi:competence protein ComEA
MASTYFWNLPQRRALILLTFLAGGGLAVETYMRPVYYGDPPAAIEPRTGELADRIDPNTATAAELSSIPQLGPARAAAVVAYRNAFEKSHPGGRAFERIEDLMKVKGIGRAIGEKLAGHLTFDPPAAAEN